MNNCGFNNGLPASNACNTFGKFTAIDVKCINTLPVDNGSIIPFSSGITPVIISDIFGNLTGSMIGFGSSLSSSSFTITGNTIIVPDFLPNEVFTVPQESKITAISATFTTLLGTINDGDTGTIRAQVFHAPIGSNVFTGTSASVDLLPSQVDPLVIGQISFASANVLPPVQVSPGDRLLMVFYIGIRTGEAAQSFRGPASAGINIV
ncbi:hypothetical protein VO178_09735 [Lysinibacillus fusiformis]|uniref:hypothetical protein n=1 Tax=Lysinibacillus fusiformis TaxID=28031 RepID=UPI002D7A010F|nr:hypothetical protein [Lysinibacillus fusiformis]WRS99955.1 hypothetical protein VO178_09735 [Lysinibacillus fusiformis]